MLNQFQNHLFKTFPNVKESKLLLACSGGVDSMVLAHLMKACKLDFAIAHCNYKLRGKDSDLDEQLVAEWGKVHGKKVFIKVIDLSKEKSSIQVKAREERYRLFFTLAETHGFDHILTAHHTDDSLETFFINLSRGTGLYGLTGIPESHTKIIRPLLPFYKVDILSYARKNKLNWREDKSNMESKYRRNKIRNEIVPLLNELHPTFLQNFKNTEANLKETSSLLKDYKKMLQEKLFKRNGGLTKINTAQLQELKPIKSYLYLLFKEFGFTQWEDMIQLLASQSGKEILSNTHRLIKDRDTLILSERLDLKKEIYFLTEELEDITNPITLKLDNASAMDQAGSNVLFVDKEKLNYPLKLRKWENADYFYPLGMRGTKKLSKFFKDEKLNTIEKESQWILCSNEDIVWVIGKRADDRFKVTDATEQILKIEFLS